MLVNLQGFPALYLLAPSYTLIWGDALWEKSALPKNMTQWPQLYRGRELGPLNLESSALTITQLCSLHHYNKKEVVFKWILYHNGLLIVFLFSCRLSLNIVFLLQIHQPFPYIRLVLCDNTGPGQIEDPRKGGLRCGLSGDPGTSCLC